MSSSTEQFSVKAVPQFIVEYVEAAHAKKQPITDALNPVHFSMSIHFWLESNEHPDQKDRRQETFVRGLLKDVVLINEAASSSN